jgi:hypothetical protein
VFAFATPSLDPALHAQSGGQSLVVIGSERPMAPGLIPSLQTRLRFHFVFSFMRTGRVNPRPPICNVKLDRHSRHPHSDKRKMRERPIMDNDDGFWKYCG